MESMSSLPVATLDSVVVKEGEQSLKISDERHSENISVGCEMTKTFLPLVNG